MSAKYPKYKKLIDIISDAVQIADWGYNVGQLLDNAMAGGEMSEADYVRLSASLVSILDPTGITSITAAYVYDTCDKL